MVTTGITVLQSTEVGRGWEKRVAKRWRSTRETGKSKRKDKGGRAAG